MRHLWDDGFVKWRRMVVVIIRCLRPQTVVSSSAICCELWNSVSAKQQCERCIAVTFSGEKGGSLSFSNRVGDPATLSWTSQMHLHHYSHFYALKIQGSLKRFWYFLQILDNGKTFGLSEWLKMSLRPVFFIIFLGCQLKKQEWWHGISSTMASVEVAIKCCHGRFLSVSGFQKVRCHALQISINITCWHKSFMFSCHKPKKSAHKLTSNFVWSILAMPRFRKHLLQSLTLIHTECQIALIIQLLMCQRNLADMRCLKKS